VGQIECNIQYVLRKVDIPEYPIVKLLNTIAKTQLLILDDFGLSPLDTILVKKAGVRLSRIETQQFLFFT